MEATKNLQYVFPVKTQLIVSKYTNRNNLCSICDNPLFPVRKELWQEETLVNFVISNNFFCEECGVFEFEPEKEVEIIFENKEHSDFYEIQLQSLEI